MRSKRSREEGRDIMLNREQDSLQACSSSIAGLLSSRAVLEGSCFSRASNAHTKEYQESASVTPMPRQQQLCFFQSFKIAWEG